MLWGWIIAAWILGLALGWALCTTAAHADDNLELDDLLEGLRRLEDQR
jgi:hypothetical protein